MSYPVEIPSCPAWLTKEAKAEWRRQTKALAAAGVLASVDRAALCIFCEAWGEYVEACWRIQGPDGLRLTAPGERNEVVHPLVRVRDRASERVLALAREFGFTPSARTRLRAVAQPASAGGPEDELHDFVNRRG